MAGPWEAYQAPEAPPTSIMVPAAPPLRPQAAPPVATAAPPTVGPWAAYQAPEFTAALNPNVVDDPARAAPLSAQAGASLRTRPEEQIAIYSRALGVPPDRFGVLDGQIVMRGQNDELIRMSPSVTGATGVVDAGRRVGHFLSRNAGEALPAASSMLASIGAVAPPTAPITIPLAGALGAVGESGRQLLGDAIYGNRPQGMDYGNIALQGGTAALGQGLGLGIGRMIERNPVGVTGSADRNWFRDPANRIQAEAAANTGTAEGITLLPGDVTGRRSLLARDRQLGRFADTADDMATVAARRNESEIPTAVRRRIQMTTGGTPSIDMGAGRLAQGATDIIESERNRIGGIASPLFERAWNAAPGNVWDDTLAELIQRPAVAQAWREAQTRAANSGRPLPEIFRARPGANGGLELVPEAAPDMRAWHQIKMALDRMVEGGVAPDGAVRGPMTDVRVARDALRGHLGAINPEYATALSRYAQEWRPFQSLLESGIGRTADRGGTGAANEGLSAMFDGSRMAPENIAQYRAIFASNGQEGAWREGLASYLQQSLNDAMRVTQRGEPSNPAGKFYQQVFGTEQRREAIAAAFGGRNTPEFQQFERTMGVLRHAARSLPEGSPTATDMSAREGFASGWAQTARNLVTSILSPQTIGTRAGDAIIEGSAGRNARELAARAVAGPAANAQFLNEVRLMPNSATVLLPLLSQGGLYGGVGLLNQPSDTPGLLQQRPR